MRYRILIVRSAEKDLNALPLPLRRRLQDKILLLRDNPRPRGTKKLEDEDLYRLRIGDYRIVYRMNDIDHLATIVAIGHRREVYR